MLKNIMLWIECGMGNMECNLIYGSRKIVKVSQVDSHNMDNWNEFQKIQVHFKRILLEYLTCIDFFFNVFCYVN